MSATARTLFTIGSGPGNSRAVTTLFASKRYNNVALIARNEKQLALERSVIEEAVGPNGKVKTYALDVVDSDALLKALEDAEAELGKPVHILQCSSSPTVRAVDPRCERYRINVSALYVCAQRYIPHLLELAKGDTEAKPALIVTSSMLPLDPIPSVFALSLVKTAQRNLMQSLFMTYASQGVQLGLINVGGPVSPTDKVWNPTNIAAKAWEWFVQPGGHLTFEVRI